MYQKDREANSGAEFADPPKDSTRIVLQKLGMEQIDIITREPYLLWAIVLCAEEEGERCARIADSYTPF
jgi:hypothetical protein